MEIPSETPEIGLALRGINGFCGSGISNLKLIRTGDISEISLHSKLKLIYKYFFECADIVLLVKNKHCFFVINRINCSE